MTSRVAVAAAVALAAAGFAGPALADASTHHQPTFAGKTWEERLDPPTIDANPKTMQVLVVPPAHGVLYQRVLDPTIETAPGGFSDLGPFTEYIDAVEDAVKAWQHATEVYGTKEGPLDTPWLKLRFDVHVVGRAPLLTTIHALQHTERWHVVVTTTESAGLLAWAFDANNAFQPCFIVTSEWFQQSFAPHDMHNVFSKAFGHCLGLAHIQDPALAERDVMYGPVYHHLEVNTPPWDSAGYPVPPAVAHVHCPSNLNVWGLERLFATAFAHPVPPGIATVADPDYHQLC